MRQRQPLGALLPLLLGLSLARSSVAAGDELFYAARDGRVDEVRRLVGGAGGVAADTRHESGLTALMWAATTGQAKVITALLGSGADPDLLLEWNGCTALILAAKNHHVLAVDALLAGGASVDVQQKNGHTALMLAAESGDHRESPTVKALLRGGANPLLRSEDGWFFAGDTAKLMAERYGHDDAADLLSKAEARWLLLQDDDGAATEL